MVAACEHSSHLTKFSMLKFLFLILIENSDAEGMSACRAGAGNLSLLCNNLSHMLSLKKLIYGTNTLTIALDVAL